MNQSLFARIASDPAELTLLTLKSQLWSLVTQIVTDRKLTQQKAAEILKVSQPRVSNMMMGKLEKFSIDFFIESLVRLDYKLDLGFAPHNQENPLSIKVKKAA